MHRTLRFSSSAELKTEIRAMEGLNPEPTVEVLYPARSELAEAPFYEEETKCLLWVDIDKKTINFLDPISKTNRSVDCSDSVSAAIPVQGSDTKLLVLLRDSKEIALMDRNTGHVMEVLCSVESDKPQNKCNDAKCDSSGRLWFGTMGKTTGPLDVDMGGGFYSYSNGVVTKYSDAALSNGIGWSLANDALYHIDTFTLKMYRYSYCPEDGKASDREAFIDFTPFAHLESTFVDGMCTDKRGRIWVAMFNGQSVTCWDPETKKLLLTVKIPGAKRITSCCFGGPNYEWLFVTSATITSSEKELADYPNSGHLFVIKDLGTRGKPPHKFKPKLYNSL